MEKLQTSINNTVYKTTEVRAFGSIYNKCIFKGVDFRGSSLYGTFNKCSFVFSDLSECSISGATFIDCNFSDSSFINTMFFRSKFFGCSFIDATIKDTIGVSTCVFDLNCNGLLTMETDLSVNILEKESTFSVLPKGMALKEPGAYIVHSALEEYITMRRDATPKQPKLLVEPNLVEPTLLPTVSHYRSKYAKILLSQKNKNNLAREQNWDNYYDDMPYNYTMGMAINAYNKQFNVHEFGYASNAVLLCSNIEEFKACPCRIF